MAKISPWLRDLKEEFNIPQHVLEAMDLPRDRFISSSFNVHTLSMNALPIGSGQTISQPLTVARMTEAIMEKHPKKVLEIGTGSGYQTAVLARLVENVFTIERIQHIQLETIRRLYKLNIYNFKAKCADGYEGWPSNAPFDAIMVTAAAPEIPNVLIDQLKDGGRMVIPIGTQKQELFVIDKQGNDIIKKSLGPINFVPMIKGETV